MYTARSIYIIKALARSMLEQHHNSDRDAFQFYADFLIKVSGKCVFPGSGEGDEAERRCLALGAKL